MIKFFSILVLSIFLSNISLADSYSALPIIGKLESITTLMLNLTDLSSKYIIGIQVNMNIMILIQIMVMVRLKLIIGKLEKIIQLN